MASQEGHANVVKILLECGASCDKQDKDGRTALHVASQEGHANVVKILLERGSDFYKRDEDGHIALYYAVKRAYVEVVKELVGFLHSEEKQNIQQKSLLDSIFLSFDKDGCSLLHLACQSVSSDIFDAVIPFYEDVGLGQNFYFRTPLEMALEKDFVYAVDELLRRGADIYVGETLETAFLWAIQCRSVQCLPLFLNRNVDIFKGVDSTFLILDKFADTKSQYCIHMTYTVLMCAILTKDIDVVKALLSDVESIDSCINLRPGGLHGVLYVAIDSQNRDIIDYLLSRGMTISVDDIDLLWHGLKSTSFDIQKILWEKFWPILEDHHKKKLLLKAFKEKDGAVRNFFCCYPVAPKDKPLWGHLIHVLIKERHMLGLKLLLQFPDKWVDVFEDNAENEINPLRYMAWLAFNEYFSGAEHELCPTGIDLRLYFFEKGIFPPPYHPEDMRSFLSFWLKKILEQEKKDFSYDEFLFVLYLGSIEIYKENAQDVEKMKDSEEEEARQRRHARIDVFKNRHIGSMVICYDILMNWNLRNLKYLSYDQRKIKVREFRENLSYVQQNNAVIQFWIEAFFLKQEGDDILTLYGHLEASDKNEVLTIMKAVFQTCLREKLSPPDIFIEVYGRLGGDLLSSSYVFNGANRSFLKEHHALVFSILLSHGFSSKDMAYLGMPLTLEERVLLQWPILPLLLEFRDIYKPCCNSYCQSGFYEPERGFAYLWRIHNRIPLMFRHSERCFFCLYDSLYLSDKSPRKNPQRLYYCPFDLDKTNAFDSLKAVALHLGLPQLNKNVDTSQGCLTYCSHMKAREFQRGIPILAVLCGDAYMKSHFRPVLKWPKKQTLVMKRRSPMIESAVSRAFKKMYLFSSAVSFQSA